MSKMNGTIIKNSAKYTKEKFHYIDDNDQDNDDDSDDDNGDEFDFIRFYGIVLGLDDIVDDYYDHNGDIDIEIN